MRRFRLHDLRVPMVLASMFVLLAGFANAQDEDENKSQTPPGLYITPTALPNAVQQPLNPGLINYPNFVAGEAVKVAVSPDGRLWPS